MSAALAFGFSSLFGFWNLNFGISAQAAEPARPSALPRFLSAQTNLLTWSADLTQTRQLKTLTQPLVSTGRVWFAAPNKFHWEIGSPAQTIAVRGADEMLVIYPRLKRVERYPIGAQASGQWKDTLALLEAGFPRSHREIEERFRILSLTESNDLHHVALEPRSSSARRMMPQITISFATNDYALRATELQFADGSTMRNEFRNAQENPALDPALFHPEIDPDFKIVEPMKR